MSLLDNQNFNKLKESEKDEKKLFKRLTAFLLFIFTFTLNIALGMAVANYSQL